MAIDLVNYENVAFFPDSNPSNDGFQLLSYLENSGISTLAVVVPGTGVGYTQ